MTFFVEVRCRSEVLTVLAVDLMALLEELSRLYFVSDRSNWSR